ncbi:CRISPR-associated endonuclease Cas2 [Anabaenopsis tanganyikae CS-531]|uniref:CRISPR-associated endoribonuclease Cas2 n=2 Tax=Anabaenopsis TaxID=110103 RepID=A0ABT5AX64_9CYAN|nr:MULTISPECIES: CRISPR-associated endonuclease Cas2 [Anabaenopsis]MDB9541267.1 CRISPR-associated endonuclease Cas2 [Anabaenopsis arnoldii]MDH6093707.1 CRISPR-associated endonuclease Cas2 [Anabaenopsis arnoldii]MDH6104413.1 CRISPR-associated endonuclease Cas2 [Anabaenopsis tanganyikae CS-531]
MFVVISYDILEDKRSNKIHKILKSYGQWMQYSVFECDLTQTQYAKLRSRLSKGIETIIHCHRSCTSSLCDNYL